ncbi:MAG: hypothetical protein GY801_38070 [bacterium]|nr:hypothetical protein [bacterium]
MLTLLFGLTFFLSAALLFWVQPMFSKMMLPLLGGVPAVWNTCLVFYQTTLLVGYTYAHLSAKWLRLSWQILLHLLLLGGSLLILSFNIEYSRSAQEDPVLWLLLSFTGSIGSAFFVLSATTPLLQSWFGQFTHPGARNPYLFYAVSNAGSLLALLSYPLLVEPFLGLKHQAQVWQTGVGILAMLMLACACVLLKHGFRVTERKVTAFYEQPISRYPRWRWMALAFVPSSLLLGVTRHITTDIAAVPLLWVVPLALYLLSFIFVFAHRSPLKHEHVLKAQLFLVLPLLVLYLGRMRTSLWLDFPLHLAAFFVFTMVCHGELARSKPEASALTGFYFWMSFGGCLGGVFTALVAPILFDSILEYPLMIALTCLLRPFQKGKRQLQHPRRLLFVSIPALLLLPAGLAAQQRGPAILLGTISLLLFTSCGGALLLNFLNDCKRMFWGLASFLVGGMLLAGMQHEVLVQSRGFFGTLRVTKSPDGQYRLFYHGTTLHGAQHVAPQQSREPLTYFHRNGPLGQIFSLLGSRGPRNVAIFGLGVGTIAAYAREGDAMSFYEIVPEVQWIAQDTRYFRYLAESAGEVDVVLGDARISLTDAPDASYDFIIQDAFSSDTIPVHLLTQEAFQVYGRKLRENGLLIFNITNRHLDLEAVLAQLFRESGFIGLIRGDAQVTKKEEAARKYPSRWVIASRNSADLDFLQQDIRWNTLQMRSDTRLWTDDYSNILSCLKRKAP